MKFTKIVFSVIICSLLFLNCTSEKPKSDKVQPVKFDQELADELARMAEVDQIAVFIAQGKYNDYTKEEWKAFKDSVLYTHQKRLEKMFDEHGFVGFNLAGEQGSHNFWLMVQHSDHAPEFQQEILTAMESEVAKGNAKASNFAFLTDRVRKNAGEKQVYGTQVTYNMDIGQAYPRPVEDSLNIDLRRKAIGLEPIEDYLNQLTEMHYEMNKQRYLDLGITEPQLYK